MTFLFCHFFCTFLPIFGTCIFRAVYMHKHMYKTKDREIYFVILFE